MDSTNSYAASIIDEISEPTWIYADKQLNGCGRNGKIWLSGTGSLTASLVFKSLLTMQELANYSFVSALALRDAFLEIGISQGLIGLKWPNDVLIEGKKVAGILLETKQTKQDETAIIIGIGVNLSYTPEIKNADTSPASLGSYGVGATSPNDFLHTVSKYFVRWSAVYNEEGFGTIRKAWLASAIGFDKTLRVRLPNEEFMGIFTGMNDQGALLIDTKDGQRIVMAGDVFFDTKDVQLCC